MTDHEQSYPAVCREVGLTCQACISHTASEIARTCKGLQGKMLGQMFVQLYPNPACSPMHARFAQAYRDASPRPVRSATALHSIAAVA
ncbi:MAG TPA: hypothetical protein VLN48_00480, partial [Bryobacteraceae bacterium]|nr:hypothetical protein [Bryobacteraceae bacterium]